MQVQHENQHTDHLTPPFFTRWFIFFRRYPNYLWDIRFFFGVISRRHPVLWKNVMAYERKHAFCKGRKHTEECRKSSLT
jgi:hypothetical protein